MSEFVPKGDVFPNLHSDTTWVEDVADERRVPTPVLERKIGEYTSFLERTDLMPRALKAANYILDRMMFELAAREGVYDGR